MIIRLTVASADAPTEFVALRVYVVDASTAVGVPEITQVKAFTDRPDGRAVVLDFIAHAVTLAPLFASVVGVTDIAVFTVPVVPVELA